MKKTILIICFYFLALPVFAQTPVFISPKWTQQHLNKIRLIDLSSRNAYQRFHLPGAIWVSYAWLIKRQKGLDLSGGTNYMTKILSQLGIKPADYVVIYDNEGNLNSSRLYWELKKLRHAKVSMLDGGITSWMLINGPVTQALPEIKPAVYLPPKSDDTKALTADKTDVLAAIKDSDTILVDARSQTEYIGSPQQKHSGHIPGAILLPWGISVDSKHDNRQRSHTQLKQILAAAGLANKDKHYILYCHTGHRAARLLTMFESLGYHKVKLYDGSMQEWERNSTLPVKSGYSP